MLEADLRRLDPDQPGVRRRRRLQATVQVDGIDGTWVLWRRVDSFIGTDGDARVYRLDPGDRRRDLRRRPAGKGPAGG